MTLACEDANSKLVEVVGVADVDAKSVRLVSILLLMFDWGYEVKSWFGFWSDVWLRFWNWCLVEILKMKYDQDVCNNLCYDLKKSYFGKEQLNLWDRCAFDSVDKKPFAQEVQTTLCLWQFF